MPRFFFHVHDDLVAQDEEGLELPDLEAAQSVGSEVPGILRVNSFAKARSRSATT
jgi:hypothetical protein